MARALVPAHILNTIFSERWHRIDFRSALRQEAAVAWLHLPERLERLPVVAPPASSAQAGVLPAMQRGTRRRENGLLLSLRCAMGMPLPLFRLSSLDLIRGFVAVGRRMSITLAAQDLFLTQSAVSRQVGALEKQLGVKLLARGHRSIAFTAEGERLFRIADSALQQLLEVVGDIRMAGTLRPVTLSASIGVTGLWLLPRLSRLQELHPGIDLRLSANNLLSDLRNEGIDLAIRYTSPSPATANAVRLFGESVVPVAHPTLGLRSLRSKQALTRLSLLAFDDAKHPWLQWSDWLGAMGWADARPRGVLHFNQYDQVIQAALSGQGIALGRLELIQPLIDEGRLVQLAPPRTGGNNHAFWLMRAEVEPREDVRRVAAWIVEEAGETLRRVASA